MTEQASPAGNFAHEPTHAEGGTPARRRRASDMFPTDVHVLTALEEQLRTARRENECLRARNQRLTRALADVAERGTAAHYLAHHDALTGLPNRLYLMQRLRECITEAFQRKRQFALLFIDLDRFKFVNDRFGHAVGDKVLAIVASRILAAVRTEDIACRYGGDEFVVLLAGVGDVDVVGVVTEKIRRRIEGCYKIEDNEIRISASIGFALFPTHGAHCDALLGHADAEMYRSKVARWGLAANGVMSVPEQHQASPPRERAGDAPAKAKAVRSRRAQPSADSTQEDSPRTAEKVPASARPRS